MKKMYEMTLAADPLRKCWAVRPEGALGTHGFHPGAWQVVFVKYRDAATAQDAVRVAKQRLFKQEQAQAQAHSREAETV